MKSNLFDDDVKHYKELIEGYKSIIRDQAQIIRKLNKEMWNK